MRRSFKLIVDTHKLSDSSATGIQAIAMETGMKNIPDIFATEQASSAETESRMRILKDSSKDFLSPYNPNANVISNKISATSAPKLTSKASTTTTTTATRSSSVLRTKLTSDRTAHETAVFLNQSFLYATVGSLVLFFGLVFVYVLIRPTSVKSVPAGASAIDKEVLIQSELLPSQTPAAMSVTTAPNTHHAQLITVTTTNNDSRTLHV